MSSTHGDGFHHLLPGASLVFAGFRRSQPGESGVSRHELGLGALTTRPSPTNLQAANTTRTIFKSFLNKPV
jgi:hypothetical protein